jgi:ferritin-like metal-binding protein YciE
MKILVSDGENRASEEYEKGKLRDAAIVAAARQIRHYQIAAYSSAICHAWALREDEVAKLLSATLHEEKVGDRRLRRIAERLAGCSRTAVELCPTGTFAGRPERTT